MIGAIGTVSVRSRRSRRRDLDSGFVGEVEGCDLKLKSNSEVEGCEVEGLWALGLPAKSKGAKSKGSGFDLSLGAISLSLSLRVSPEMI